MNYEKNFWEKYEFLHERFKKQTNHISNLVEILKKFQNNCFEFNKNLTNVLSKNYVLFEEQNSTQNEALKMFTDNLKFFTEEIFKLGNFFKSNLIDNLLFDSFIKEEKEKFNEIKKNYKNYNDMKILVEKNKKIFENSSKNAENNIISTLKLKHSDVMGKNENLKKVENQMKEICETSKNHENKYIQSIYDANKIKNNYVNLQIKYLNFFENFDKNLGNKINNILTDYIKYIKKLSNNFLSINNSLEDNFSKFSLEKDINNFINQNKCEYKCIEDIIFTPFQASYDMKSNFNNQEINYQYIVTLKKYFKGVFPNFDLEEEKSKFELRKISAKVFKIGPNIFFTDEEKQILINFIKEEKFRKIFLIELSKQRTKGRYSRSKKLIQDLNDILNVILEDSEKENDYESGINCIILSLTFYYEDKNKEKVYLFEYIKDNKWLGSIEFWKSAIQSAITKEIEKNKQINKNFEKNKSGIMNIVFGQLIPYTSNMKDFNIEKGKIIEIIDEYVEAYNLTEEFSKIIYDNICNEEELKQLREKGICGFKDKNYLEKIKNEEKEKKKDMKKSSEENKDDKKIKEDDVKNESLLNKENKKDDEKKDEKKEEEKNNENIEIKNENKKEEEIKNNNQKDEENKNENENKKEEEIKSENKNDNQKEEEIKIENKNDNQKEEEIKSENKNDNQKEEEIKSETQKEEEIKNENQKEDEQNESNKKNEIQNEEENKNEN